MNLLLILFSTIPYEYNIERREKTGKIFSYDTMDVEYNYWMIFEKIQKFLDKWQVKDSSDTNFGGMIEAEAGDLSGVVQTDNTLEAIWVWSRYGELTGDTITYRENINMAWNYCDNYPAWEEEGSPGYDYYRVHNCAWALLSVNKYCNVYNDTNRKIYAKQAADYIITHPLNIYHQHPAYALLNSFVTGWAAGNLYHYGKWLNDQKYIDTAIAYANRLIEWININPQQRLSDEFWAMSSGTIVWGLCNSIFLEDTIYGKNWIMQNGHYVDTFQVWYNRVYDYYDWDNAWNVGFANAHYGMYNISHDEKYKKYHKKLTKILLSYDTDRDAGIQATTQDPNTEDMSWITCYLTFMCVDKYLQSAGICEINKTKYKINIYPNPSNYINLVFNEPLTTEIELYNALGEKIKKIKIINKDKITINDNLPQGIYFIKVSKLSECKKVTIIK